MSEELRIGEDNICPVTKNPCDDECCPPGAICNISGGKLSEYSGPDMGNKKLLTGGDPTPRQYVESLLPSDYQVSEMMTGIIRCKATNGVEEDSSWDVFFESIKAYFRSSFREVHHWVCHNHKDFTIYYSYEELYNLNFDEDGNYTIKK